MDVDKLVYGSIALDLFVFDVDKSGKVLSVEVPALEMKLVRKG